MYFWSLTSSTKVTYMTIARFIFWLFTVNAFSFHFWGCGIRMDICILTRAQKGRISGWKHGYILPKILLLKLNFSDECHLYANCLLYILIICRKYLLFLIRNCSIRMNIPIQTGFQNGSINPWRKSHIFRKKMFFLKLTFQDEGHLYTYCLLYILIIYCNLLLFQISGYGIRMHIPILIGVQNGRIVFENMV